MKLFKGVRVGDKALEELEKVVIEKDEKVIGKPKVESYGKASISEAEKAPILQNIQSSHGFPLKRLKLIWIFVLLKAHGMI